MPLQLHRKYYFNEVSFYVATPETKLATTQFLSDTSMLFLETYPQILEFLSLGSTNSKLKAYGRRPASYNRLRNALHGNAVPYSWGYQATMSSCKIIKNINIGKGVHVLAIRSYARQDV
jgi:hypothetical protein